MKLGLTLEFVTWTSNLRLQNSYRNQPRNEGVVTVNNLKMGVATANFKTIPQSWFVREEEIDLG